MWILAAAFDGAEAARLALDDMDREIGLADGGEIGRLAPSEDGTSRRAIAAARVPRERVPDARAILTRFGGLIVADIDAARVETTQTR
jgi:hypothetical protein